MLGREIEKARDDFALFFLIQGRLNFFPLVRTYERIPTERVAIVKSQNPSIDGFELYYILRHRICGTKNVKCPGLVFFLSFPIPAHAMQN